MSLKQQILDDIKAAMRSKEMQRLGALRLLSSEIKQKEVDQRIELADADVIAIIGKMLKQRKDSISQFDAAGRTDLSDAERAEVAILQAYLPEAMSEDAIRQVVQKAVADSGLTGPQAMGKVMPVLKAELAGKADMSTVSAILKEVLAG